MRYKSLVLAAALAAASWSASAATTVYAEEIIKGSTTFNFTGAFSQSYDYILDAVQFPEGQAEVGFAFTELRFKDVVNIDFGSITLRDANGNTLWTGTPTTPSSFSADALSFSGIVVPTREFSIDITGTIVGSGLKNKGSYSFEMIAAPVPEPETISLAVGGLALVGVMMRKRAQNRG